MCCFVSSCVCVSVFIHVLYVSGFVCACTAVCCMKVALSVHVQLCVVCKWLCVRVHVFVHAHLCACLCVFVHAFVHKGRAAECCHPSWAEKNPSGETKDLLTCWARHNFSFSNDHFCEFVKHFNHWRRKHSNVVCNAVLLPILTWLKQQT